MERECQTWRILAGDVLDTLATVPGASVQTCITSPPYWGLRDYGHAGQIGLEPTPGEYVTRMVEVFSEVHRVLRDDGTLWLNLGDSYAATTKGSGGLGSKQPTNAGSFYDAAFDLRACNLKPKDLVGIPWMVAFALRDYGWYLRSDIIWSKPNPMPESVTDRPTKSHEYLFLLTKNARYYYDAEAIKEPAIHAGAVVVNDGGKNAQMGRHGQTRGGFLKDGGVVVADSRNRRSVWTVPTQPYPEAHFATYPEDLIRPCVLAGSREGDTVLDPFTGSGTTGAVAIAHGRHFLGCELNPAYIDLARKRIGAVAPLLAREVACGA